MIKAGSISDAETGESNAIPLVRMHSPATEHVFQQCSDIGALIFVVPTVDTVQQAQEAAKWVRYPPVARRSTGGGQHGRVWGNDYANTYNDNCILFCMVETAVGIANAHDIARVPGVDVVITGNCKIAMLSRFVALSVSLTAKAPPLQTTCSASPASKPATRSTTRCCRTRVMA